MINKATAIYVFIDDFLKLSGHKEHPARSLSDAELLTTAVMAAMFFGCNLEKGRSFMKSTGLIPSILDKSRFSRRLHTLKNTLEYLFFQHGHVIKQLSEAKNFVLDSFPVPICDNIRIANSKLVRGEKYRGKICAMRRYFYGIKVHIIINNDGIPVEYCLLPGSYHDAQGLKTLDFDLPENSKVYADAGYTNYQIEDLMKDGDNLFLEVQRKNNSKRPDTAYKAFFKSFMRKKVETVISCIKAWFPRHIHAVNFEGFKIKISLFLLAFQFHAANIC